MSVVGWLQRGMERVREERNSWPRWLRRHSEETNDLADFDDNGEESGLDNGDGVDKCSIWWCPRDRYKDGLVCESNHDNFELVLQSVQANQEETDGK